ncbi:lysophospholipid acyltransferase family protein [Rhodovulum adriaticum]|uniref:KDO2-lipid IV(A) lauroyltransferase n=1 Tax=Rhodovulum adriaticum TaxID=35804 RepID=A0A4R2NVB3_RHOAD|nr:lauroyl acyltransferase [Rhodovulum adriaticum]MBK1636188.1 lauroyl acyltransferase [Rhodovulum adriaticum]TCP25508.1 KDO2-lipid IV(A) lauroyltransferase [Rhodovulum adriaticum]
MGKPRRGPREFVENLAARAVLGAALALPYRWRVPFVGWVTSRLVAPLAGYDRRVRENLAHACPDLPEAEVRRLMRAVPDNFGRTLIELYSGREFARRFADAPIHGPGAAALEQAHTEGRPVMLVTGHFGNYDAVRAALIQRGYNVGGLYNPMRNDFFNAHYVRAISSIGEPLFPRGRAGMARMLRFVKGGGMLGIVLDQYMRRGADLTFFGKTAPTALSAADMALKYDALVVPIYGIRQPDGLSFRIVAEAPVPHADRETMTQALNDSLEARVRQHMAQWLWIHRRWKPERTRRLRAKAQARAAKD